MNSKQHLSYNFKGNKSFYYIILLTSLVVWGISIFIIEYMLGLPQVLSAVPVLLILGYYYRSIVNYRGKVLEMMNLMSKVPASDDIDIKGEYHFCIHCQDIFKNEKGKCPNCGKRLEGPIQLHTSQYVAFKNQRSRENRSMSASDSTEEIDRKTQEMVVWSKVINDISVPLPVGLIRSMQEYWSYDKLEGLNGKTVNEVI